MSRNRGPRVGCSTLPCREQPCPRRTPSLSFCCPEFRPPSHASATATAAAHARPYHSIMLPGPAPLQAPPHHRHEPSRAPRSAISFPLSQPAALPPGLCPAIGAPLPPHHCRTSADPPSSCFHCQPSLCLHRPAATSLWQRLRVLAAAAPALRHLHS